MKKILLSVAIWGGLLANAQTYTVNDTIAAGDSETFYVADSNAVDYATTTGTGVTWDYGSLFTYAGTESLDTIKNASDSPDFGDFSMADYHDDLAGGASNYFTNYEDSVLSYGYKFFLDGNIVKIMHNIDPLKMMSLPMSYGDTFSDSTYGVAEVFGNNASTEGDVVVTADGTGELILGSTTISNVIRIKLVETIGATIDFLGQTASGTVNRTVYSYYDLANQSMPVFIHASISVNSNLFNGGYTAVYSSVNLEGASIGEELSASEISIYPNPADNIVTISAPEGTQTLTILNAIGQSIQTIDNPGATNSIDVSEFQTGIYFIQVVKGDAKITKKLFVK